MLMLLQTGCFPAIRLRYAYSPLPKDETWMQNVAGEMNLSETAFLVKQDDGFNLKMVYAQKRR